jgi:HAMP domain-containing protein
MLRNIDLNKKFTLVLTIVFMIGVLLSGLALSAILNRNAENEVTTQAEMLMQTMIAVRSYTDKQVNPLLAARLDTDPQFIPQTVPGYSAREVFENLRTSNKYTSLFYKEATLNPTNLRDKADTFETKLIESLRKNKSLNELRGYRQIGNENLYYIAKPLIISEASCLVCHSTPEAAPKSLLATYGSKNGFGWKLNEIVGAQVMSVPASHIQQAAQRSFLIVMAVVLTAFAIAILITNILLKKAVVYPIKRIVNVANEVSTGNMEAEFEHSSNDEIGMLAIAFNRMKISLSMAMDMLQRRN